MLKPYFSSQMIKRLIQKRLDSNGLRFFRWLSPLLSLCLSMVMVFRWVSNQKKLKDLAKKENALLSQDMVFQNRLQRMLDKVNWINENKKKWDR